MNNEELEIYLKAYFEKADKNLEKTCLDIKEKVDQLYDYFTKQGKQ